VSRTGPLAIDDSVEVRRITDIGGLHCRAITSDGRSGQLLL
jgi:hypothetical protein